MKRFGLYFVLAVKLFLVFLLTICKGKHFLQRIINFKKNVLSFKNKHVSKRGDSQFYTMSQLSNIWGSDSFCFVRTFETSKQPLFLKTEAFMCTPVFFSFIFKIAKSLKL